MLVELGTLQSLRPPRTLTGLEGICGFLQHMEPRTNCNYKPVNDFLNAMSHQ